MDATTRIRGRRRALAAALAAVAMSIAACGGDSGETAGQGDFSGETATTEASEVTTAPEDGTEPTTEGGDVGSGASAEQLDLAPVTGRYGDIEFTIESAEIVTALSEEQAAARPEDADAYAVLEVTAENQIEEFTWNFSANGMFFLDADGETFDGVSESFALEGLDPETRLVFPLDQDVDLGSAVVRIQEAAESPDDRRRALEIPLDGTSPEPLADPVDVTAQEPVVAIANIGDTVNARFVSADLVTTIGTRDNGGAWPGDGWEGLRQAREGYLFLRVTLELTKIDDSGDLCVGPWGANYVEDGVESSPQIDGFTEEGICSVPVAEYLLFEVPEGRDSYGVGFGEDSGAFVLTV